MKEADRRRLFSQVHRFLQGPIPFYDRLGRVVGTEEWDGSRTCIGGNRLRKSMFTRGGLRPCDRNKSEPMRQIQRRPMATCIRGQDEEGPLRDLLGLTGRLAKTFRRTAIRLN